MGLDISHFIPTIMNAEDGYMDYIEFSDLEVVPKYLEKNKEFITEKDFEEFGIRQIIYLNQIGYQRKGMSDKFYSDFKKMTSSILTWKT
jgi:hypothetical protein